VRYVHFDASSSLIVSPGVTVTLHDRAFLTLRYYRSETDLRDVTSNTGNGGFGIRAYGRAARRLWVHAGYLRGFEGLESVTVERLSQLDANTMSVGARFEATPMTSIGATYEHQWRSDSTRVAAALITFIQRF
jgi:hypothetical protein